MPIGDEGLTKLTRFDRTLLSLLGIVTVITLCAVLNAPFHWAAISGTLYFICLQLYGRLPRPHDLAETSLASKKDQANQLDQLLLADNLSNAICVINSKEQIIYTNGMADALFGQASARRPFATVMRDPLLIQLVKTVLSGSTAEPVDYHPTATVNRHLRVTATPIDFEGGGDSSNGLAMLVFYDVTDLVKFAHTQGDFLANASHELKTPVASLLGYIETLRGHAKDDPAARERFLIIMQEQAERMQRLISDLLSLRQIEQSEHLAPITSADVCSAVRFALDTVSPLARARGVKITITGANALLVKGHQDQLVQLCLNILDNAVKMTPKGETISLHISKINQWRTQDFMVDGNASPLSSRIIVAPAPSETGFAVVTISDRGIGLAPDHIPRLGERFYRIVGDRISKDKGTGLGLAIVKHIVRRHRGGLLVRSRHRQHDGKDQSGSEPTGTTFTVMLPLHTQAQSQ